MHEMVEMINKQEEKKIFFCSSMYQLIITLVIISSLHSDDYFIVFSAGKREKNYIKEIEQIIKKLRIEKKSTIYLKDRKEILFGVGEIKMRSIFRCIETSLNMPIEKCLLINYNWYTYYIHFPAVRFFEKAKKSIFIEDSPFGYVDHGEGFIKMMFKRIYGLKPDYYLSQKLLKIYVQNCTRYKTFLQPYLSEFKIKELFDGVPQNTSDNIMRLFLNESEIMQIKNLRKKKVGIIFTQCLSEEGYCTEEEKKSYYRKIIDFYKQYGEIVIKTHPREKTNYCFGSTVIFDKPFPSELFALAGVHFFCAIGICTGAINSVDAEIAINLNENFYIDRVFRCRGFECDN